MNCRQCGIRTEEVIALRERIKILDAWIEELREKNRELERVNSLPLVSWPPVPAPDACVSGGI